MPSKLTLKQSYDMTPSSPSTRRDLRLSADILFGKHDYHLNSLEVYVAKFLQCTYVSTHNNLLC